MAAQLARPLFLCAALVYSASADPLPVITSAGGAHSLSTKEARREYPIRLHGIVTCVDPTTGPGHSAAFVHDSSGTIYVQYGDDQAPFITAGTLVDVAGVTGPGSAAPIVANARVKVLGHASPENPPRQDLFHLTTGAEDGKWVEVEGTIHSASVLSRRDTTRKYVTMQLAMVGGTIGVSMLWEAGVDYSALIDSKVRIHGNAAPLFNRNDQIIGARMLASGIAAVRVVEPAPGDPFLMAVTPVNQLLRWNMMSESHHRVHLRGTVTLQWPGTSICIADSTRGICAQTDQDNRLASGDLADVVGFAEAQNGTTVLTDAVFRQGAHGAPVAPRQATASDVMLGQFESELVRIDGRLIGSDLTSTDINLLLSSGDVIFHAALPKSLAGSVQGAWENGSTLRITGICSIRLDVQSSAVGKGIAVAKSFRLLMRSPDDVIVMARPSWWNATRAAMLLGVLLLVVFCGIAWIARLRRSVRMQTEALRQAREEAKAIDELSRAMGQVSAQRELSARVSAAGSEQIAQLGMGFNRMLSELEDGDRARKAAEAKLQRQALTDELTALPNRRAFCERLEETLDAGRARDRLIAVVFIDLDGFKAVNDTQGHAAGDRLLVEVSRRLRAEVRECDLVGRLGGDEFTILLDGLSTEDEAGTMASRVLQALQRPILIDEHEVAIGASIGISLFPKDGTDAPGLLREADSAMYAAKSAGKNQIRFFTPELGSSAQERMNLEIELRHAIARGEIHLSYQPEFDVDSHRLIRFEALARWTHPQLGSIPPVKFIPVAEESGQIVALGAWVLREACREAAQWQALSPHPVQVAVNVSSVQFSRGSFVDEVALTLRATGLRPELLQIELTESIMLTGEERATGTMRRLHALGVSLAIDDFGTGYSCLGYLPNLPFDIMKIDRSFVRNLAIGSGTTSVVRFLISLAHSLHMQVVVEGIETPEQLEIIRLLDGNEIQGFLLGRPTADPRAVLELYETPSEPRTIEEALAILS